MSAQSYLGIELGSTRIKACLIGPDGEAIATGSHSWENQLVDGLWTYSLEAVHEGLRSAYADLVVQLGEAPTSFGAIGVSAMMHGYLAFDENDEQLVPFRTWRNTTTSRAAPELSELFGVNIPLRWSVAHLYQAVLDQEPHVPQVSFITTLAGYVHWRLTGRAVLGVGDASGMFPIDSATRDYDAELLRRFDERAAAAGIRLAELLPEVLVAGQPAGELTPEGAALLDPNGLLRPGALFCPPEGVAGTGMVATDAVAPRTGNVSAGTSIFAMVVLEHPLRRPHEELDLVTTPSADPVAMVHCNNGASEFAAWVGMFTRFSELTGSGLDADAVYEALLTEALSGDADAGGLLAYNYLAGEPITVTEEGRPLFVRTPDSAFTLANAVRAHVYGVFGTLSLGMRVLSDEGVALDRMNAHGGIFRTAGVAQRFLAAALDAPVAVGESAAEGGAWGIAVLAAYAREAAASARAPGQASAAPSLAEYLGAHVFQDATVHVVDPEPSDVAGFAAYLDRYRAGLAVERAAVDAL
jgi:sugar (pentulose or hexulose) kinase